VKAREQRVIEEQEKVRRSRAQLGLVQVERSLCPRHEWRPFIRAGSLPPRASACPGCLEEQMRKRSTDDGEPRRLQAPRQMPGTPRELGLLERWRELERLRHPDRPEPGSDEEREAVEHADRARGDALAADEGSRSGSRRHFLDHYSNRVDSTGQLVGVR
jgi:hypothetical protein